VVQDQDDLGGIEDTRGTDLGELFEGERSADVVRHKQVNCYRNVFADAHRRTASGCRQVSLNFVHARLSRK
jgi:hypothetical protein